MHGAWQGWYSNAKDNYKGNYIDGKRHGKWEYWFEKTGKPREVSTYMLGIKHGKWIQWTEPGFVDTEGKYRRGKQHGEWKYYYETGGILKTQHFEKGDLSGKCVAYNQNNTLQSITNYKVIQRDKVTGQSHVKSGSVPHGTWIFYDKNGAETSRIKYKDGIKQQINCLVKKP